MPAPSRTISSDTRQVTIGNPGSEVIINLAANTGDTKDIGAIFCDLAANYQAGNPDPNAMFDLDTAIGSILDTRARAGA